MKRRSPCCIRGRNTRPLTDKVLNDFEMTVASRRMKRGPLPTIPTYVDKSFILFVDTPLNKQPDPDQIAIRRGLNKLPRVFQRIQIVRNRRITDRHRQRTSRLPVRPHREHIRARLHEKTNHRHVVRYARRIHQHRIAVLITSLDIRTRTHEILDHLQTTRIRRLVQRRPT